MPGWDPLPTGQFAVPELVFSQGPMQRLVPLVIRQQSVSTYLQQRIQPRDWHAVPQHESPATERGVPQQLSCDSLFRAFESLLGRVPTEELIANFISKISWGCQMKPLSKDKDQSDSGCHKRVITFPKVQAEHITSYRARWASYLPVHITIWNTFSMQPFLTGAWLFFHPRIPKRT